MRWLGVLGLVTIVACGGEDHLVSVAEQPGPQQLVIPPMDAGAPMVVEAPVDAGPVAIEPDPGESTTPPIDEVTARDVRAVSTSIRSQAVVVTELQGLEQILTTIPTTDPKHAVLLHRTADEYAELAHVTTTPAVVTSSRKKEVAHLTTLINNFPSFARLDEARYYRGLAYERLGDLKNARSSYYDLIKHHPTSKLIPFAYFAFGELFFADARSDPSKWDLAKQAFMEVLKYPPPANGIFPFALLRVGQVADAHGDSAKAQSNFDRLRRDFPTSAAVKQIPTGR